MAFDIGLWTRLEHGGVPVYVRPDKPDWFVPNRAGDELLRGLAGGRSANGEYREMRFLDRLPDDPPRAYAGRAEHLKTDCLRELWLHVTNRCNLSCTHCLFASAPTDTAELSADRALDLARQAGDLGCRVFALTGGEPFMHPRFGEIVQGLLAQDEAKVVLLTNGTLLRRQEDRLARWPRERVFLQISLDGDRAAHDRLRGPGAFDRLQGELAWLGERGIPFTLATCVQRGNAGQMPALVDLAAEVGASNVHFLWYFVRGRGGQGDWARPEGIFEHFVDAAGRAEKAGIGLDNVDAIKTQVFAPPGTIHDGGSAGWDCLAVGPRGRLYPSAAMVGLDELATDIDRDLAAAWRGSDVLGRVRNATAAHLPHPLGLILGGGDPDHCYSHAGTFVGNDPYWPLHERTALWLIARAAARQDDTGPPRLRLKMGDLLESCGPHGPVATVHSNCLLAVAGVDGRTAVREFYTQAARNPREDVRNPVSYPAELVEHIPEASRIRSYGCGSPVLDAGIQPGQCVLDLGSGSGVECFIAARLAGREGRVIGIDMLDSMLGLARAGAAGVAKWLGYENLEFRKGFLEDLPLADASVDVVLSNCVINLSTDKRRTFAEILRVLKPAGRLVVSDVVCETEPSAAIRNDEILRGQCIGGALTQRDLFGLLDEAGLAAARVIRRRPYRTVGGHAFFSMTFEAHRPGRAGTVRVLYRGPAEAMVTRSGMLLPAGQVRYVPADDLAGAGAELLTLDEQGLVVNADPQDTCGCECGVEPAAPPSRGPSLAEELRLFGWDDGESDCRGADAPDGESTESDAHFAAVAAAADGGNCCGAEASADAPSTAPASDGIDPPRRPPRPTLLIALLAAVVGLIAAGLLLPVKDYLVAALAWTRELGAWGPVFLAAFYVAACVLMLPGSVISLGAGLLFGVVAGTVTVSIGSTLGACAAFWVGRTIAREWVARKVAAHPRFAAVNDAAARQGFRIVLLMRLSPIFPFNLLNYAFGLTRVPFWKYALASWLGMLPGTVLYVYLGSGLRSLTEAAAGKIEDSAAQTVFFWAGLAAALAVVVIVTRLARAALEQTAPPPAGPAVRK